MPSKSQGGGSSRTTKHLFAIIAFLLIFGVGNVWASNAHHCLIGEPIATWKTTDNWSKSYEEFALTSPANTSWDEFCIYMWVETNQTFAFNNHFFNPGDAKQVGPSSDQATLNNDGGTGKGVATDGTTNAWKYTGATGLVKICAAQSSGDNNQGEWKPYVWVEEAKEIEILKGNKIMFYFGMTTSWNEDWNVLRTSNTTAKTADQQYHRLPESKCSSWISVAYVSPAQYYVGKTEWAGVQMEATAEAGCLYSVYNDGSSDKIYKNVAAGAIPHFSTTTVNKTVGTTDSEIAATVTNSIYGNEQVLFYYYTTDGGTTFTKFDPSDISSLAVGVYTVYALGWDGHILVRSDNTVTLNVGVTISLNANGGTDGDVTSVFATSGVAASTGNIASASLPTKTGYTFNGFWTSGGTEVIDENGEWIVDVSGYTDDSGNWTCSAASTLYAHWTPKTYTINLANMEADDAGTESVEVTYDASTNMTSAITKPTKAHYDFGGYYTSEDVGETLDHQLIDEDGNWVKDVTGYTSNDGAGNPTWVHDYAISLYAKWTETAYTITMAVSPAGTGTTSPASTATGKLVTESGDITATPAAGYKFKEWQFSKTDEAYDVWCADGFSSTDATIHIKAQHNGTLTAVFEERYSLVGSLQDDSGNGGMPGWEDYSKTFTVNSSSPVDLTRTCTLQADKTYKVQVHDLATGTNLGRSGCDPVCVLEENASLVMENSNNDVFLYTSGAGEYIFKITAVDGSGHPTLTVLRPYPVNFGEKYQDIDGTLHSGTTGGTASASASGALSSGDYVTYNTSVTHTATPEDGYTFAGWWSSDEFEGDAFSNTNPMTYAVTSGDNTYAKFVETSTTVTLANDDNGKVQIGGEDATSTTCGVTTTRELTAVANAGYKFKNWTTSASPDFEVDDADAATVTLTGHGAGTAGTLTANFTECWVLSAQSEGWGSATFTISNISDVSGDAVGYVDISLPANTDLEFTMVDNSTSTEYKNGADKVYYMTYTNHTDWDFATGKTYNCGITTAGKGTYRFTWNITDKTMTVTYPLSYQVNYDAYPSVGGSVTVVDDDSQSVPSGGYVRKDGSVTYTAAANTGFTFEGWYTDDTYVTRFSTTSSWTDSEVGSTSNSYAKFNAVGLSFTGGAGGSGIYWNDASNWSPACVPTIYHDVTIPKYCEVGKYGSPVVATAKNIVIDTVGHSSARLLVNAGYALAVEEMIKVKTSNTPTYGPTTENLLKLESDASYKHGALAVKGYNDEQMDIVARVEFHTQSCVHNFASLGGEYAGFYVNQFIGTPLRNPDLWDYYGCWIYKWDPTHHDEINDKYGDWVYQSSSTPLEPFRGYDILSEIEYPETYWLEGQLVYAQDTTLDLYYNAKHVTDMGAELGQENMFANSWTAPIDVSQMTTSDFAGGDEDKMEATIYVFNSGWPNAWEELKDKIGTLPGQYLSMSVKSAEYTSSITCIPAMQAFSVFAKTAGASLTLDYDRIVYNPLLERSTAIEPMRAPRRARTELSNDDPEIMRIRVEGAQGADQMHLLLREDFHADFDNGWDARKMFGESYAPQIFAITEDGNMSVNCIPDAEGTVLGFRKGSDDSEYTFRFEYDGEETLYLNDLVAQTSTLIDAENTYTFTAAENDIETRFVISASPIHNAPTGLDHIGNSASKVHKLMINGVLYIIRGGRIYNASGMIIK